MRNNYKNIIFGVTTLAVFGIFKFFLSSGTEAFFMSIPIWVVLGFIIFRYPVVSFTAKNIVVFVLNTLLLGGATAYIFLHLQKLLFGRILWHEVVLAVYFLVAIAIFIATLKVINTFIAKVISERFKNQYMRKGIYWLLICALWFFIVLPFIIETFALHRPKIGDALNPKSAFGLSYESVSFQTKDHVHLDGWFIPGQSDKTVIIGHGLGANKSNFLVVVDFWHGLGFNTLIFDFRGHGQSQGHTISLGYNERQDIEAGLDYLVKRKDIDHNKIIGYGVSFGGAAMTHAAAEDQRIKAMVIDSSFANFDSIALDAVARMGFVPPFLIKTIAKIGLSMASLECGFDLTKHSPQDSITHAKQPALFIHGKNDTLIPWEESQKLFHDANEPKKLYLVETAGHYSTLNDAGYRSAVIDFLKNTGVLN